MATVSALTSIPGIAPRPASGWRPTAWRLAAVGLIWATSLFVVALWVRGAGVQSLIEMNGDTLTTLGRLTGLVSANLLLYQVLLMARVPVFERGFGRDGIVRLHRLVGFWSFWLLMAHLVLISVGYAVTSSTNLLAQVWDFVWDYPGMLLATAGTGLLVLVVVTSIRRARRRLRYESWHLLHLYGYLGVGLAIPHMLWTGADFTSSAGATAYWWALWAGVAACALWFRIAVPLIRSLRHGLRVVSVSPDGVDGVTVRVAGRGVAGLGARAGQFFVWRFLDGPGWTRGHPFSLASAPVGDELVLSARRVGDGTDRLAALRPGTPVLVEGPFGAMTGERRSGSRLLMLAAGAGVAPLVALLQSERYGLGEAILVTRDHTVAHGLRRAEIDELVMTRGLVHYTFPGRRASAGTNWVPESHAQWDGPQLLRRIGGDLALYDVYLCGPVPWMRSVRRDLRSAGVAAERIHSEAFAV